MWRLVSEIVRLEINNVFNFRLSALWPYAYLPAR